MTCTSCDGPLVRFAVPAAVREHAPEETSVAAICADCLDVTSATGDPPETPGFVRIDDAFPTGEGGAAFALLVGTLPSVTMRKDAAVALRAHAERSGVDVHLAFDRLIAASERGALDPAFDLARRVRQFESLVDE
ncbi:MAG: DUF6276 family protein [Halobaculum sp.]